MTAVNIGADGIITLTCATNPPTLVVLPQTFATALAAVNLLTASGDLATPVSCGSNPALNCPGGNPLSPTAKIRVQTNSLALSGPDPNGTYNFLATMSAVSPTPIPFTFPAIGDCGVALDTSQGSPPSMSFGGQLAFSSHVSGGPVNQLNLFNLNITGFAPNDITLVGSIACQAASLSADIALSTIVSSLTNMFVGQLGGNEVCGAAPPALFGPCGN
jgi:hypothetical protein